MIVPKRLIHSSTILAMLNRLVVSDLDEVLLPISAMLNWLGIERPKMHMRRRITSTWLTYSFPRKEEVPETRQNHERKVNAHRNH